jgi:hypothetical protein
VARWTPGLAEVASLVPLLLLRAFGVKQWTPRAIVGPLALITPKPAELFVAFGANLSAGPIYLGAFDIANADPQGLEGAGPPVYIVGPIPAGTSYTLDLFPLGSRRFDFGIVLAPTTDARKFVAVPGGLASYHAAYQEL